MKRIRRLWVAVWLALLVVPAGTAASQGNTRDAGSASSVSEEGEVTGKMRDVYAFDNCLRQVKGFEEKAALLQELGYDGIVWRVGAEPAKMIEALDRYGLRMVSTYARATVDANEPGFDRRLADEIDVLKQHKTNIWLYLVAGKNANDEAAVKVVNKVADLAEKAGLQVVLYPHTGFYVATVEDALRITKKVDRPNVGMSFNLCHFLKTDDAKNLEAVLKKSAPHLRLVSINGADAGNTQHMDWDRLIRPLGDGSFDVGRVIALLEEIGYTGPVILQGYNVKGDNRENLRRSMAAWEAMERDK